MRRTKRPLIVRVIVPVTILVFACALAVPAAKSRAPAGEAEISNSSLAVQVRAEDGSYGISSRALSHAVLTSGIAVEIQGKWLRSADYPHHTVSEAAFDDALGHGQAISVRFSGLAGKPELEYRIRLYNNEPYGDLEVEVHNATSKTLTVGAIRMVNASGEPRVDLGGPEASDRVMAESFSEDPTIHIGGLDAAPHGVYFGVQTQLLYNLESKQSLLLAALTADRFLTVSHLSVAGERGESRRIASLTVDSTGTTEGVVERDQIPVDQQIQLTLPIAAGGSLASERLMFAAGPDYLAELEAYGEAVRKLHHPRIAPVAPMGWWSWTAFYGGLNEGEAETNAEWLSEHLKRLGYDFFHIDEGYDYARGEYTTANATQFPNGMLTLSRKIAGLGLRLGVWTAPFEVSERAWVYEHHPDWLVHDAHGKPIFVGYVGRRDDRLYVLDVTNPAAQEYLRQTYRTLTRDWGVQYIKLDFMDSSAVEGYRYKPNVTALQALRQGLEIIRSAVGDHVLLDKDGCPLLTPVGLVDEGRISVDTGHDFAASKDAAPNIAVRFYVNRNFYISDPDAFSVSRELEPEQRWHESKTGLTLDEAEVQVVLAAVAGGMYEIGDDLPTLGADPERLALAENQELIDMNRLGRAALPLDLMSFPAADEQPSVFLLHEDRRQTMLAVFNWTEKPRSHRFTLAELGLPAADSARAADVLDKDAIVPLANGALSIDNQPPHSVRLIKLVDSSVLAAAPTVTAHAPSTIAAGATAEFSAEASASAVPALAYHWTFGDGTDASSPHVTHTYTLAGSYKAQLNVTGLDGIPANQEFTVTVTGFPPTRFDLKDNRRYAEPKP
jgi:alpha-galactosidase